MAKRGRPRKNSKTSRETKPRERESRHDKREEHNERNDRGRDSSRGRGNYGGGKKEYTQVGKLFESKYGRDKYWGKVQREKLEALIERLETIFKDHEAASFNVDLNGKWGPFMSVTNADEYESKERGRGRDRDNDRDGDSDWDRDKDTDSNGDDKW